ncbi:MAG: hypothetical protein IKL46_03755 [Clostridia bacterium]|nr:hypothetical protein [Clostridia bacterium]
MFIKKTISLFLLIIFVLSAFVGCNDVSDDASSSITTPTSSDVYNVDDDRTESNDNTSGDNITSSEEIDSDVDSSDTSSEIIPSDNTVSVGDSEDDVEEDAPPTFIEPDEENNSSINSNSSEITNVDDVGYNGVTLSTAPNYKTGNVTTVKIAANGSVTYKIRSVSNKYLTINSSHAYVVYNNKKYEAKNGVLSFFVESDKLASDQIVFEIGNKGSSAESFVINFASPMGSMDNKEKISTIGKEITTSIAEGEEAGYWYQFKATKAGTIKFYLLSGTDIGMLTVTNNRNSAQRNTDIEEEIKFDSTGKYIELTNVEVGDEIDITLAAKSNGSIKYPAVTIKWKIVQ